MFFIYGRQIWKDIITFCNSNFGDLVLANLKCFWWYEEPLNLATDPHTQPLLLFDPPPPHPPGELVASRCQDEAQAAARATTHLAACSTTASCRRMEKGGMWQEDAE
jgi:hypothetical protein